MSTDFSPSYIYALGRVTFDSPDISIHEEFEQAKVNYSNAHSEEIKGKIEQEVNYNVLSDPRYYYIVRKLCWIFRIENHEAFVLIPENPIFYNNLVEAYRKVPKRADIDVVIGKRGPLSEASMCRGRTLPIVYFDQLYPSDIDEFISEIGGPPREEEELENAKSSGKTKKDKTNDKTNVDKLEETIRDVLEKIMQLADNLGSTDEHRAINYLAVRSKPVYIHTRDMYNRNFSFIRIETKPSTLSFGRKIVDVIFIYRNRQTRLEEEWYISVDVTTDLPFSDHIVRHYVEKTLH